MRAGFGAALNAELTRLDHIAARGWQAIALAGVFGALVLALTISKPFGLGAGAVAAVYLGWFSFAASRFAKGESTPLLMFGTLAFEVVAPWAFALQMVFTQSAAYALSSWVPPMLFSALIIASVIRLRPRPPLFNGVFGAAVYLAFYFALARGKLSPADALQPVFRPGIQITRAISLLIAGVFGSLVVTALRRAIGRADASAREQDLFGKYRLLGTIASGGMGTVVEALYCPEGGFERRVAIKRIHPHFAEQKPFVDAFRAEAALGAQLSHPNIVQVLDFGKVGDTYFLAMEFIDGLPLSEVMARVFGAKMQIAAPVAAHVARELLAGLAYSHDVARATDGHPLRVVHRDVCPQNVLVSKNCEVKLTDFGIARALGESDTAHTRAPRGHLAYVAPEQLRALEFTARTDLYGVAVILWELLASERLFARTSEALTLTAVLANRVPPVSGMRSDLDASWDRFLERALADDPLARFASAAEMVRALDALPNAVSERTSEALAFLVREANRLASPESTASSEDSAATVDISG
jgi:serine/threonine-protein kinase